MEVHIYDGLRRRCNHILFSAIPLHRQRTCRPTIHPLKSRNRPFKPLGSLFAANTCARIPPVIQPNHSSLPPQGKPGFHAEWLRDGPCDATTTCLGKPGVWCQLSLASAGNMRFGGRFSTLSRGASHGFSSPITFALNRAGHAPAYPLSLSQIFARDE
jgi:hypothetical protein